MSELGNVGAFAAASDLDAAISGAGIDTAAAETTPAMPREKSALARNGANIYRNLSTEEKQSLNANSGKVHFICALAAKKLPTTGQRSTGRKDERGNTIMESFSTYTIVGYKFRTDIEITIPAIPFQKPPYDVKTKLDFASLATQTIPAGTEFVLTRLEAMYMMAMPELQLNGFVEYNGDAKGVRFDPKLPKGFGTDVAYPTPAFKFADSTLGSIKNNMDFVDDGEKLYDTYAEKFADLYVVRAGGKSADKMPPSKASACTLASLEIARILGMTK